MKKAFNNEEYEKLVSDILNDMIYGDTSYRGKISFIRQYSEIIVRKIFDISPTGKMQLSSKETKKNLEKLNYQPLTKIVNYLNNHTKQYAHTQMKHTDEKNEYNILIEKLFDLISIMFVLYFRKHTFGANSDIVKQFSLLPPIIRYKVLSALNEMSPDNEIIIEKLVLAMLKAYSFDETDEWIESRKEKLCTMGLPAKEYIEFIKNLSPELLSQTLSMNLYNKLKDQIEVLDSSSEILAKNNMIYSTFEEAMPYYRKYGPIKEDSEEIKEFNDIMEFVYLGRKDVIAKYNQDLFLDKLNGLTVDQKKEIYRIVDDMLRKND